MKKVTLRFMQGIVLILSAIFLTTTPVYTSVKTEIVGMGGSIELAILIAWSLIAMTFTGGVIVLRIPWKSLA